MTTNSSNKLNRVQSNILCNKFSGSKKNGEETLDEGSVT